MQEAPLIIYGFVGTRDKGHRADTLIRGQQEQRYKCAASIISRLSTPAAHHTQQSKSTLGE